MKDHKGYVVAPALGLVLLSSYLFALAPASPQRTFACQCSICHGGDANGTDRAPGILPFVRTHSDAGLSALVRGGQPDRGMPKFEWNDAELQALTASLRGLIPGAPSFPP